MEGSRWDEAECINSGRKQERIERIDALEAEFDAGPSQAVQWGATYADQDPLALEVDIGDGELAGERHFARGYRI
jgi:hypothetical protein